MSARAEKNTFGLMIETAHARPVLIEKHGHGVVVMVSVEAYERHADGGSTNVVPLAWSLAVATSRSSCSASPGPRLRP